MSEPQPAPQPEGRPDARPRPDVSPAPAGADSYTAPPKPPEKKRRWGLWLAALIAAAAAGTALRPGGPLFRPKPSEKAEYILVDQAVLRLDASQLDEEGTKALQAGAPLAAGVFKPGTAPAPIQAPAPAPAPAAAPAENWGMFQMRLVDDVDMDGDVVEIFVDGRSMGQVPLSHGGAVLRIPLKRGQKQVVRIVGVRDGVGGITLGVQTSGGHVQTRLLMPGQYDEWIVDLR